MLVKGANGRAWVILYSSKHFCIILNIQKYCKQKPASYYIIYNIYIRSYTIWHIRCQNITWRNDYNKVRGTFPNNKLHWQLNQDTTIFIQGKCVWKYDLQNVSCLSRPVTCLQKLNMIVINGAMFRNIKPTACHRGTCCCSQTMDLPIVSLYLSPADLSWYHLYIWWQIEGCWQHFKNKCVVLPLGLFHSVRHDRPCSKYGLPNKTSSTLIFIRTHTLNGQLLQKVISLCWHMPFIFDIVGARISPVASFSHRCNMYQDLFTFQIMIYWHRIKVTPQST